MSVQNPFTLSVQNPCPQRLLLLLDLRWMPGLSGCFSGGFAAEEALGTVCRDILSGILLSRLEGGWGGASWATGWEAQRCYACADDFAVAATETLERSQPLHTEL